MFEISNYNNFYSYKPSKSMFYQIKNSTSSILEESLFYSKLGDRDFKMTIGSLFSFGSRGGDVSGDYDESSTEEDPVIRVWGEDSKACKEKVKQKFMKFENFIQVEKQAPQKDRRRTPA